MTSTTDTLQQFEAIELAHALVAWAADRAGVRALAIKGLVATVHGLREAHASSDVDVLVEPAGFDALTRQLREWGWRPRVGEITDFVARHHSITYLHDRWPCDIDVHRRFPGLLAPPEQVFEVLWERREVRPLAARPIPMADWAGSVAIMALHAVRGSTDDPRGTADLDDLTGLSRSWTRQQRDDLATLAVATGCAHSLDAVWPRLGVAVDATAENVYPDVLAEWRLRQDRRLPGVRAWLEYIRDGGPRHVLPRLAAALWPPESLLRASRPIPPGRAALARARLDRLVRAVRSLF